jgi:hypothetical protein
MTVAVIKSHIGKEDCEVQTNTNDAETFTRLTSTGAEITLTKIPDIWGGTGLVKIAGIKVYAADSTTTVLHSFGA